MAKGTCFRIEDLKDDKLALLKSDLREVAETKKIPPSEINQLLKTLDVKEGLIENINNKTTLSFVKQFFDGYEITKDPNFDAVGLRAIAKEKIPSFGVQKFFAPVYYVLSQGGPASKRLANKLLDFDVTYTMDKSFASDTINKVTKVLGKNVNNMELLEPEMRTQKGRVLTKPQEKAIEAFDLINPETKKLWNMYDNGFENLDTFTQKHIIARDYHKQMTDFYWERTKQEVKANSSKYDYEVFLKEFNSKYIQNYMTRAVSKEVLQDIARSTTNSPVIVKIAEERLPVRAAQLASKKYNKKNNPDKWNLEYEKQLKDDNLLDSIKEEAYNILTYNPARVVNVHFKERGILLPYEMKVKGVFGKEKTVRTYVDDYKSVMDRYSTVNSKFVSTAKYFPEFTNFGKKYKLNMKGIPELFDIENTSSPQAQYSANAVYELLGITRNREDNSFTNFLSNTATLSAASGLSSPTSGVKNLLIGIPRQLGTLGMITTARGYLSLFDSSVMDNARRKGYMEYQTKTLALQDKAIKIPFLGKFSMDNLFKLNLMQQTEGPLRASTAVGGLMTFQMQLDKIHGKQNVLSLVSAPKRDTKKFWKNVFKLADDEIDFLLDAETYKNIKKGYADTGTVAKMDYIKEKVAHYSHVSVAGGTGSQLLPYWASNKYVKPLTLFYRMAYSTSFDMYQNHLKPIVKEGNLAPITRAALGSYASGAMLWGLYDLLFDVKNPTENEGKLDKAISHLFRAEFLQLGSDALNPYQTKLFSKESTKFLNVNDEMMAASFNPIYSTAVGRNLISAGTNLLHVIAPKIAGGGERKFVGQAMDDFLGETLVLYAQYRKNFNIPDPFKGTKFKRHELFKVQKEFSTYANRWKQQNGYTENHMAYGINDRTPFYRDMRAAFFGGTQEAFDRAYWTAYNYIATTYIKEFRANGKGPNTKEIHKLTMSAIDSHLNSYSIVKISEAYDGKKGGIVPEKEFLKYLKTPELVARYKKAKKQFEYRKRNLVAQSQTKQKSLKYSVFY